MRARSVSSKANIGVPDRTHSDRFRTGLIQNSHMFVPSTLHLCCVVKNDAETEVKVAPFQCVFYFSYGGREECFEASTDASPAVKIAATHAASQLASPVCV